MRCRARESTGEDGFVLPFVLAAIVLLALSLTLAIGGADDLGRGIERTRGDVALEVEAFSAEARLAHLLLTEPIDHRGLRVGGARLNARGELSAGRGGGFVALPFDGRVYASGPLLLTVQDEAGLVNVNAADEAMTARALDGMKVSPRVARRLAATLADHVDADDLTRAMGAETRDGARNAPVATAAAVTQAIGWRDAITPATRRRFLQLAAALPPEQRFNLNTAPAAALAAATGLEPRVIDRVIAAREQDAVQSVADIAVLTGARLAGGIVTLGGLPARQIRFTAWLGNAARPLSYQSRIVLGDDRDAVPIRIDPAPLLPIIPERSADRDERRPLPRSPLVLATRDG